MNEYLPLVVIFLFVVALYAGTILWTEVLFPDKERTLDEQEALRRAAVEHVLAALQPGLFDNVEAEEKKKPTLTPAFRR